MRTESVFKTGAQRDTPELPVELRREGFLSPSDKIGAQQERVAGCVRWARLEPPTLCLRCSVVEEHW